MQTPNGNGSADGDGFDMDAVLPDLVELGKTLVSEVAAGAMGWDEALLMMADAGGMLGYRQGQADLRARFLPVTFTKNSVGFAELKGAEAEALLKSFGLDP